MHHTPSELEFVNNGYGIKRYNLMYNDYILLGPRDDDNVCTSIREKLLNIKNEQKIFLSRADNSGTNIKEMFMWNSINLKISNFGKWYKKIPMYYHNSNLLTKSIDMFYSTLKIIDATDSICYYNNIFSKLYPDLETDDSSPDINVVDEKIYDKQYTIQIGAFKEYSGAESRMYMLISQGFAVRIEEIKVDNEILFSVREGIYSTKKSANKIVLRIKARTGLNCMIIEL